MKLRVWYKDQMWYPPNKLSSSKHPELIDGTWADFWFSFDMDMRWYHQGVLQECDPMLWVGKVDKNGKDIYDKDYIMIHSIKEITKKEYWNPVYRVNRTDWGTNLEYIGGGKDGGPRFTVEHYSHKEVEVIGNIYEDTILIKKKNNEITKL